MKTAATVILAATASRPLLDHNPGPVTAIIFFGMLAICLLFAGYSLVTDISDADGRAVTWVPCILLGVALFNAIGFEFVNGFHDTANAVATVIYTHSLPPIFAVVWTGVFNFVAVLVTSGAVAFGILSLLPVELILQVGSGAGFAMVFVLQIAAIPCAGVSVAHGPADGQKGIGSIMHFLVGNVPTAYALNRKCLRSLPMHASLQEFS